MENQGVELQREELYEKVWMTPTQRLSKEFGLSDVGLAKLCRRYEIPVPGRGYWRQLETGQKPVRPPLPKLTDARARMQTIRFTVRKEGDLNEALDAALSVDAPPAQIVNVLISEDRPISHPFALRAKRLLSSSRKDERGILIPEYGFSCPLKVSSNSLPRALRILDALLFAIEQSNISLSWPEGKEHSLAAVVLDEKMTFSISEAVRQKPLSPDSKKAKDIWWRERKWEYEATGLLRLSVDELYVNTRHRWKDAKRQRVEDCLGHFISSLSVIGAVLKKQSDERARQHREWMERCRREEEEKRRRAEYFRQVEVLKKLANAWQECNLIRAFVDKMIDQTLKGHQSEEHLIDVWAVVALASDYLQRADPMLQLPYFLKEFEQATVSGGY